MSHNSPAFQFYPKDWLSNGKVKSMTLEERGAYIDLLAIYWNEGGLPSEPMALSRLLGVPLRTFNRLWKNVSRCFEVVGPNLSQSRLEIEKAKQADYREAQRVKGLKSANSRVTNKTIQPVLPSGCDPVATERQPRVNSSFSSPFSSSSSTSTEDTHAPANAEESDEIDAEEKTLMRLLVDLRDTGVDVSAVCDSLERPKGQAPFNAFRALMGGKSGIPRTPGGLTVRRRLIDALEARQRAQAQPYISDKTKATFDTIDRVLGTGAYSGMAALPGGKR